MPLGLFTLDDIEMDYNIISDIRNELYSELNRLEDCIMRDYKEIDLHELSQNGRILANEFEKTLMVFFYSMMMYKSTYGQC